MCCCCCCCCCSVLKYQDWVWSVVARGGLLLVASGPEVHVHDLPTGKLVRKVSMLTMTYFITKSHLIASRIAGQQYNAWIIRGITLVHPACG